MIPFISNRKFTPAALFAAGEQGAWYDPSDLSTLYQDSAGTTPVTGVEQPVGLMLDKSKGLVPTPFLSSDFSSATGWTFTGGWGISGGVASNTGAAGDCLYTTSVPSGWYKVSFTNVYGSAVNVITTGFADYAFAPSVTAGAVTTIYLYVAATRTSIGFQGGAASVDNLVIQKLPGNHAFQSTSGNRPTLSARVNLLLDTTTLSTQTVTTQAATYTLSFSGTGTITLTGTATGVYTAGTYSVSCTAGSLIVTVAGLITSADLRPTNIGNNLPAYQRVTTATDYDTAGFPLYLKANGSSSAMQTNSIDFTATDKMTVVAGVRKLSDASVSLFFETSVNTAITNGTFGSAIPAGTGTPSYNWVSTGTTSQSATITTGYAAPISNVVTGQSSISTPLVNLRVNGTQAATSSGSQGTGNYGNYPLYLFARAGTSLFFNGHFYGAIIRGATTSGNDLLSAESYMNKQSGGLY